ncbi:MAG TPA: thioredoxin domain-containing protein [Vicinamibacteria bacterium]|nr:thioredoxin domain-containing protein [Vicinamibacteria bacterium]
MSAGAKDMTKPGPPAAFQPSPASLAALAALGAVAALVSLFLWGELVLARAGGATACALSDPEACARLWDGPLASTIHRVTGLPVAGWGLAWALAAAALPLVALVRAAEGRPRADWLSAARITAAAGLVAVLMLMSAAVQARTFCVGCFFIYVLVSGYAGIALLGWRALGLPQRGRAALMSLAAVALAALLLLYPGLKTRWRGTAAGFKANDDVSQFVASLTPPLRQTLADSLHQYRQGIAVPSGPPRTLIGSASAPLRITDFTDIRCGHCAELHETLAALEREAPAGSFSVEPRQFPLDAECNPYVRRGQDPVRCLAARARICVEGRPGATAYAGRLFGKQETLSTADVYALAEAVMPRRELEACVARAETSQKLQSDIELAARYQIDGTPLVLLNGRKATSFPPFLYAMVLTGGRTDHPAFASLPAANPSAQLP